jgi:hypothetical protein
VCFRGRLWWCVMYYALLIGWATNVIKRRKIFHSLNVTNARNMNINAHMYVLHNVLACVSKIFRRSSKVRIRNKLLRHIFKMFQNKATAQIRPDIWVRVWKSNCWLCIRKFLRQANSTKVCHDFLLLQSKLHVALYVSHTAPTPTPNITSKFRSSADLQLSKFRS